MVTSRMVEEIVTHYRSRYPILYMITHEEDRAIALIAEAAAAISVPAGMWPGGGRPVDGIAPLPGAKDAGEALETIARASKPCLFVMKDFHQHMGNPAVVRRVRDAVSSMTGRGQMAVIISPVLDIPAELEKEIALLDLPLPDEGELLAIFNSVQVERESVFPEDFVRMAVRAARGLTAEEARRAFLKALIKGGDHRLDDIDTIVEEKRRVIRKYEVLEFVDTRDEVASIGGLMELKRWLMAREKAFSDDARKYGLPAPKGLLLCGVQGCGKSLTARAVAGLWKLPLLRLDLGAIFSSGVTPEEGLRRAIKVAVSLSPAVLWIDEIEKGFTGVASNTGSDNAATRAFGMFITWMQEKKEPVFVVATANEVGSLPPELLRKGRFDDVFFIDLPDAHEREEILRIHLISRGRDPGSYALEKAASMAEHFSGAELEQVVISALFRAYNEKRAMMDEDIEKSIRETVPLYRTYEEKIKLLREWAKTRTRQATMQSKMLDYFG
jgi:SpoVK/Ycf46/Vps4 family AAA+-type ATPase